MNEAGKGAGAGGLDGDFALLDAGENDKDSLLVNAGFEEPATNGVVTSACNQPSPYGPMQGSNSWWKVGQ